MQNEALAYNCPFGLFLSTVSEIPSGVLRMPPRGSMKVVAVLRP
jgi:hypothetical protein